MIQMQPKFVKKSSSKHPWIVLGISLTIILGLFLYWSYDLGNEKESLTFSVCNQSYAQTQNMFETMDFESSLVFKDYLIYGETLNIYAEDYVLGQVDPFVGKTLVLKNLCDGYEWVYMMEKNIDGQIPLELLPEGFYELYIVEDLKRKRLVSNEDILLNFYPIARETEALEVTLLAQNTFGTADELIELKERFFFLDVHKMPSSTEDIIYDLVIDPAHSSNLNGGIEKGRSAFSLIEANETLRLALLLKEDLEKSGLKVYLTRDDHEDVVDLYGVDGRLYQAYQVQAKYYIELNMMYSSNETIRGSTAHYSRYASNRFATLVFKSYLDNTTLVPRGTSTNGNIDGVKAAPSYEGYDAIPVIRESGGRILGAGTMSEASMENAIFNKDARIGMQSLSLDLIYISNQEDVDFFTQNLETLSANLGQGIIDYLRINP
jgi:N-acetylmuramoyl-L-alanine amidase